MKKDKTKALIILSPGFPENEADTSFIPPQHIFVNALKEVAPNLHVLVLTLQYPYFSGKYRWYGVSVVAFGGKNKGKIYRFFTGFRVWLVLRRLRKKYELIGLLSFWLGKSAWIGKLFGDCYHIPHYCWLLGQDAKKGNKYYAKAKWKADSLIALSDFIVREFAANYQVIPQHIIPVGIDPRLFGDKRTRREIDILGVGSLIPIKQYEVFLSVIKSLQSSFPDIKVLICGEGPERARLSTLIHHLGLAENVTLIGKLEYPQVLEWMQRSRILLHTSSYEGFGAVCLEALYAGAHVVSFVRPMDVEIPKWKQVDNQGSMVKEVENILNSPTIDHEPVMLYPIQQNAKTMLGLFGYHI